MNAEPLPVEMLATEDERRLRDAAETGVDSIKTRPPKMSFLILTKNRRCRDRARIVITKCNAILWHASGATHTLHGVRGLEILTNTCRAWNSEGRDSPDPTRCAGDYLTETSRRKFYLSPPPLNL